LREQIARTRIQEQDCQKLIVADTQRRYAAAQCLSICTATYDKLPREVRDMVYIYIIGESTIEIDQELLEFAIFPEEHTERATTPRFPERLLKYIDSAGVHLWDAKYSGMFFSSELIETWYRHTTFSFKHCQLVPEFLNNSRFGYGVAPREWVRNIKILRFLMQDSRIKYASGVVYHKGHKSKVEYHDNSSDVHHLDGLHKQTHVIFDFDPDYPPLREIFSRSGWERMLVANFKGSFPKIGALLDSGCRVSVVFAGVGPLEVRRDELTSQIWEDKLEAIRKQEAIR